MNRNPWVEKFRPDEISKIILNDYQVTFVQTIINELKNGINKPLIISGTPGVGKTTTSRCLAKKMLGKNVDICFLELNAADDRKIITLEKIVPTFCKKIVDNNNLKVILFDEADNITEKCQMEIKNYIIEFEKKTLFIFTCNDSSKIIADIQSLSRRFEFHPLSAEQIYKYLKIIADSEKLDYTEKGLKILADIAEGDMRCGINDLYSCSSREKNITPKLVYETCNIPDPIYYKKIIDACRIANLVDAHNQISEMIDKGFNLIDIVVGLLKTLEVYPDKEYDDTGDDKININIMKDEYKIQLSKVVSNTKIDLVSGLRTNLQMKAMVAKMIMVFQGKFDKLDEI